MLLFFKYDQKVINHRHIYDRLLLKPRSWPFIEMLVSAQSFQLNTHRIAKREAKNGGEILVLLLLLLLLLLLITAIEFSLGGSSPYPDTYKTNKNKCT